MLNPDQPSQVGHIWIKDGKIFKIGDFPLPKGVPQENIQGKWVSPGWIDANFFAGRIREEGSSEVTPYLYLVDEIARTSPAFAQARQQGVTTVAIASTEESVIGARSCVLKTSADFLPLILAGSLKITLGPEPNSSDPYGNFETFYSRRPRSRLGLYSVIRDAFSQAKEGNTELFVLGEVLQGKVPLQIRAHLKRDIRSALQLSKDWKTPFLLEGGIESLSYLDEFPSHCLGLLYAPPQTPSLRFDQGWGEEQVTPNFSLLSVCVEKKFPFAITSSTQQGLRESVWFCARYGLSEEELLRAVTLQPARLLGIETRVGSLDIGKDADIVVFSANPFQFSGRVERVYIQGSLFK